MTVNRTYECDLCHAQEGRVGNAELFGIRWTQTPIREDIEIKGVREVEHHLCRACIESIQRFNIPAKTQEVY